jgi:transcriptional regulator with XRE-family HTH domain
MGQSIRTANVKPELLAWARTSRGFPLAVAAEKVGVTPALLQQWEAGEAAPTVAQLRKAATVYKRSLAVFFLPAVPADPSEKVPSDFRRLPGPGPAAVTPELRLALRTAHVQREAALELAATNASSRQAITAVEASRRLGVKVSSFDAVAQEAMR